MSLDSLPAFSPAVKLIIVGAIYEHYKGSHYKVLAIARHSETLEELVVYQAIIGTGDVWVRPLTLFTQSLEENGLSYPRFKFIE